LIENLNSKIETSPVLILADLPLSSHAGTALAVLGHPIGHSLSPAMHNAALAGLAGHDREFSAWRYFRFDVSPADLPNALARLHAAGFFGLNLTVPHKIIAVAHVAEIDPDARHVGAVNTLRRTTLGWRGYNTDGYGLATAVRETLGLDLASAPIILLGAGGAARGAAVECLQRRCASLTIVNRTRAHLDTLLAFLAPLAGNIPLRGLTSADSSLPAKALLINATSAGLRANDLAPIDLAVLPRPAAVYDMIYNPPQTPLLRAAAALDVPHANGLSMLVHQGAKSLEIWSGVPAAQTAPVMLAAARAALASP